MVHHAVGAGRRGVFIQRLTRRIKGKSCMLRELLGGLATSPFFKVRS